MFGRIGRVFGRLGITGLKHGTNTFVPSTGVGQPMGLLLALTYSS